MGHQVQVQCWYRRGVEVLVTSLVMPGLGTPTRVCGEVSLSQGWGWKGPYETLAGLKGVTALCQGKGVLMFAVGEPNHRQ